MESNESLSPNLAGQMNVFFDVQGTPIREGIPRPREVFAELADAGHDVYL